MDSLTIIKTQLKFSLQNYPFTSGPCLYLQTIHWNNLENSEIQNTELLLAILRNWDATAKLTLGII